MKRLVDDVDVLLVIGAANSSNAKRLVEVARTAGTRAYLINDVGDIRPEWLQSAVRVGITAGASTPEILVTQAVEALRGEGVKVREVHVVEEDVRFALPQELDPDGQGAEPDPARADGHAAVHLALSPKTAGAVRRPSRRSPPRRIKCREPPESLAPWRPRSS